MLSEPIEPIATALRSDVSIVAMMQEMDRSMRRLALGSIANGADATRRHLADVLVFNAVVDEIKRRRRLRLSQEG